MVGHGLFLRRGRPGPCQQGFTQHVQERDDHALFKVREATGPVLLKCGLRAGADVADAFLSYATGGTPPGCEMQAVDEVGDLLIYEVSGRVLLGLAPDRALYRL